MVVPPGSKAFNTAQAESQKRHGDSKNASWRSVALGLRRVRNLLAVWHDQRVVGCRTHPTARRTATPATTAITKAISAIGQACCSTTASGMSCKNRPRAAISM